MSYSRQAKLRMWFWKPDEPKLMFWHLPLLVVVAIVIIVVFDIIVVIIGINVLSFLSILSLYIYGLI